jgi:ketosteroid isomerase-like protein
MRRDPITKNERPIDFRHVAIVAVVSSWLMASLVAVAAQRVDKADPQALIQLERSWNEAFYKKDVSFIERVLADEFIAIYEDGSQGDRARELLLTREFNQQVDSARQDGFVVKRYGDTAVVWFTLHLVGPRQGQPVQVDLRYVDVFVWRADRWQCVSSHSTKVEKTP